MTLPDVTFKDTHGKERNNASTRKLLPMPGSPHRHTARLARLETI